MVTKKSLQKIKEFEEKNSQLEKDYLRVLADYQNQNRRYKEQESQIVRLANASLLEKMIQVLDSIYLAQNHLKDQGLGMVISIFEQVLSDEGLTKINALNQKFDPHLMECIETVPGEKDHVVEVVSPGYQLFDKVLRPAKVKVGSSVN